MDKSKRAALSQIATSQRGLFSVAQAAQLGISARQLARAGSAGHLRRVRRGIYAFSGVRPSPWDNLVAASLAAGPDAVLSHESAAAVHGFDCASLERVELTIPFGRSDKLGDVVVHRSTHLDAADITTKRGLPVTTPARTVVDMAGRLGARRIEKVVDEALISRVLTPRDLQASLARSSANVHGRADLERLVELRLEGPSADSVLELRVMDMLAVFAPFEAHFRLVLDKAVYVLDVAWPADKVAIEVVGRAHRVASRTAFDQERRKLTALAIAGWRVGHITAAMSCSETLRAAGTLLGRGPGRQRRAG